MDNLGPIIVIGTLIIGFWIWYGARKSRKQYDTAAKQFWAKEYASNQTRKKDISGLDYLIIPIDKLPLSPSDDEEVAEYQSTITALADKKILDLTGISNTDLKLQYGVANLSILTEYDNNYNILINTLARWGARLFQLGYTDEAVTVLEYGISIGSDITRNYYLLAEHYLSINKPDEIERLISLCEELDSIMVPAITRKLKEYRDAYTHP